VCPVCVPGACVCVCGGGGVATQWCGTHTTVNTLSVSHSGARTQWCHTVVPHSGARTHRECVHCMGYPYTARGTAAGDGRHVKPLRGVERPCSPFPPRLGSRGGAGWEGAAGGAGWEGGGGCRQRSAAWACPPNPNPPAANNRAATAPSGGGGGEWAAASLCPHVRHAGANITSAQGDMPLREELPRSCCAGSSTPCACSIH